MMTTRHNLIERCRVSEEPDVAGLLAMLDDQPMTIRDADDLCQAIRDMRTVETVQYPAFALRVLEQAVDCYFRRDTATKIAALADEMQWHRYGRRVKRETAATTGATIRLRNPDGSPYVIRLYDIGDTADAFDVFGICHEDLLGNSELDKTVEHYAKSAVQQSGVRLSHMLANPVVGGNSNNTSGFYLGKDHQNPEIVTRLGSSARWHACTMFHELAHHFDLRLKYRNGTQPPKLLNRQVFEDEHVAILASLSITHEFGLDVAHNHLLELLLVRHNYGRNRAETDFAAPMSEMLADRYEIIERWQSTHNTIAQVVNNLDERDCLDGIDYGLVI